METNHLNRVSFVHMGNEYWLEEAEIDFIETIKNGVLPFYYHLHEGEFFESLKNQQSFIKRMVKYNILIKASDGLLIYNDPDRPMQIKVNSGETLEKWIRDNWEPYSTNKMEVVTVKGFFDMPDHFKIFIAHEEELHSYVLHNCSDLLTDEQLFKRLEEIKEEINL